MLAMIIWLGGFIAFHQHIRNYKTADGIHTDAIAVLTGGRNRIAEAVKLYNNGAANILIISGVAKNVSLQQLERENNTSVINMPEHIIVGNEATNTIENAIEVSEAIRRNNIHSIRLVTSYYHMPRSETEILAQNPDLTIIPHPVYSSNVSRKWWKRWNSFCLIAGEYNKYIYVYLKNFFVPLLGRL